MVAVVTMPPSSDTSPVALMAKVETSTSLVARGLSRRSRNDAEKVMGDVVVRLAVVRDTSDRGEKTPGLKASEDVTRGVSME
jgi:hypothetical protein